jgi:uncharacterized protein (TIGR00730 family)
MAYQVGDPEIDATIAALVETAGDGEDAELIGELITTALKLYRDRPARGDLKLINTALKEMRYSTLVFSHHEAEPKVTVFGSARTPADDPNYVLAKEFSAEMAARGWGVITGAGPGIMQAANEGAGPEHSYGVNIRLPFEASANPFLDPARTINFKYFFTRKLGFVKEAHGFALFPGGFGTMDETFELLTLIQTGKSDLHPIVLLEAEGTGYWAGWIEFVERHLVDAKLISPDDRSLYKVTTDVAEAVDEICGFYDNYHSQRFVDGRLVLRLHHPPTPEEVTSLETEFGDIIESGGIEVVDPSSREVAEGDHPELARVAFRFDRRHFGRLRQFIDRLNELVPEGEHAAPGEAFTEAHTERDW